MVNLQGGMAERAWDTIVEWYAAPGAEQACLALQDRAGLGVTSCLALLWLAADGHGAVSEAGMAALLRATAAYRTRVLEPLREARRALREWVEPLGEPAAELRGQLLQRELEAERLELLLVLQALEPEACRTTTGDPCGDACLSIARYLSACGVELSGSTLHQHLVHLLCTALEDYDSLQVEGVLKLALQRVAGPQ